jgi:hypothetical protein
MIPKSTQRLIDAQCEALLDATIPRLNRVTRRAFEKQLSVGMRGEAGQGIVVGAYFDYFKTTINELFGAVLAIADASEEFEDMEKQILDHLDERIRPFQRAIEAKVAAISAKPFSEDEPNIATAYRKMRERLAIQLGVSIERQKKERTMSGRIHIDRSQIGQIGDHNVQNVSIDISTLISRINAADAPPQQKEEAKGILRTLLSHPLVAASCGGAVSGLLALLK